MIHFLREELKEIYLFLKADWNEAVVISTACLVLTLHRYHPILDDWFISLLYYVLVPLIIIVLIGKNPLDFGLRLGKIRIWGPYVAITCLLAVPILYATSRSAAFQSYYRIENFDFAKYSLNYLVTLFASEFLFRGFLLFGLEEKLKEQSIFVQMIPFVLVHFGKPELETVSTIITGIYFGWICYRGKSFWPAYLIHIFINIFFVAAVNLF